MYETVYVLSMGTGSSHASFRRFMVLTLQAPQIGDFNIFRNESEQRAALYMIWAGRLWRWRHYDAPKCVDTSHDT